MIKVVISLVIAFVALVVALAIVAAWRESNILRARDEEQEEDDE